MYHASIYAITDIASSNDICLANNALEALPYLEDNSGWLYCIEAARALNLADESELEEVAEELGHEDDYSWESADRADVRAALAARGFDGVEYEDQGPDNAYEHDTVRVWATDALTLVAVMPIR